jgi:uncharacterized protein
MARALLTLSVLPQRFAICRLQAVMPPPLWAMDGPFWCIIGTADETSIVCAEVAVPSEVLHEGGWRVLKCEGPLDFALTGIVASIAEPLANAGVPIFPLATYDTDYVLVKDSQLELATQALIDYGHVVHV